MRLVGNDRKVSKACCCPLLTRVLSSGQWWSEMDYTYTILKFVLFSTNSRQCDPGHATNSLFESLHTRPPMIMLLGAACSSVTRATAQIGKLWNLVQVNSKLFNSGIFLKVNSWKFCFREEYAR